MFDAMESVGPVQRLHQVLAGLPQHEVDDILDSVLTTSGTPEDQYDAVLAQWVSGGPVPPELDPEPGSDPGPAYAAGLRRGPGPDLDQFLHALVGHAR